MDRTTLDRTAHSRHFSLGTEGFLAIFLVALLIAMYFLADGFYSLQNIMLILRMFSYIFIAAIGMTMIMVTGNIDISFGSVISVLSIIMAATSKLGPQFGIWFFLPVGMVAGGLLCGLNAMLMTKFRIPSLVITLATMQIYSGVLLWVLEGSIYNLRSHWTWLSFKANIGGYLPLYVVFAALLLTGAIFFFKYSRFAKRLYAIGNNVQGATYAGIDVNRTLILTYVIAGVLLAFSAAILATAGNRVTCTVGNNFEMKTIAAVVVGGTSAMGGSGTIYGTALGALLLAIVSPALIFMGFSSYWTDLFTGGLIVLALAIGAVRNLRPASESN